MPVKTSLFVQKVIHYFPCTSLTGQYNNVKWFSTRWENGTDLPQPCANDHFFTQSVFLTFNPSPVKAQQFMLTAYVKDVGSCLEVCFWLFIRFSCLSAGMSCPSPWWFSWYQGWSAQLCCRWQILGTNGMNGIEIYVYDLSMNTSESQNSSSFQNIKTK